MKKIGFILAIFTLCFMFSSCSKKQAFKIIAKDITKEAVRNAGKEGAEEVAKNASKRIAKSYVGRSFGEQVVKKAARDKVYKLMEKEGANSFLKYSEKKAAKELTGKEISLAKKEMLASVGNKSYKNRLLELRRTNEISFEKGGKTIGEKTGKEFNGQMSVTAKRIGKSSFSEIDNARLIKKVASKVGLTDEKSAKLLKEMSEDPQLAQLIHENPEFNITRWLNARKHVNKLKITRLPNGRKPVNAGQYAGNTFYFNPHLNRNLLKHVENGGKYNGYTYEQLIKLDKMYPNGVPFNEAGFPDFIKAHLCFLGKNGKPLIIKMPNGFTGNRDKDFAIAREIARRQGLHINEYGYIWHHLETNPPSMILVKTEAHEIVKHAGGHALVKATH